MVANKNLWHSLVIGLVLIPLLSVIPMLVFADAGGAQKPVVSISGRAFPIGKAR
ncbi:MAG: hypothetical protein ABFD59_06600 [Smithella sp.]